MQTFVFALVLTAAFTHAVWNFFSKKISGDFTLFWYGLAFANLLLLPYSVFYIASFGIDWSGFYLILLSAFFHGLYYFFLLYSYARGDISTAYPIARGTGVAGTVVAACIILGETVTLTAAGGIILIISGILSIGISRIRNRPGYSRSFPSRTTYYSALLTGVFIFSYSITDKVGVERINPVVFINFVDLIALLFLFPFANREGAAKSIRKAAASLKDTVIIGIGSSGTYILILFALRFERASYIVPMREFSVVIASVMGFIFLKEKVTPVKMAGIVLITLGLIFIRFG